MEELRRIDDERFMTLEKHLIGLSERQEKIMNNHLEHIAEDLKGLHTKTDDQTKVINDINVKVNANTIDLEWLKRFFWIIATAIVGLFVAQILK